MALKVKSMKRLWMAFGAVMIFSFLVLGWIGTRIFQEMPPIPDKFVTTAGAKLIDSGEVGEGQNVWQSLGGMQVGSIWGHGSYVAPDWTADWLHRVTVFILDKWAKAEFSKPFADLDSERQAQLSGRLLDLMRDNTYEESTGDRHFIGAAAMSQAVLMNSRPNGQSLVKRRIEAMIAPGGIQNCGKAGNCQAVCPKNIPLMNSWGRANRAATIHVIKKFFDG